MTLFLSLLIMIGSNNLVLFDFSEHNTPTLWQVINDDVMGGKSQARFELTPQGTARFSGTVSLENNGGFSSIRYTPGKAQVDSFSTIKIRLKGDGKRYQLRIKESYSDYFSYATYFQTSGEWEVCTIPLKSMYPTFRGQKLNRPNFRGASLVELSFLIGNKRAEAFTLELQKAWLE